MSRMPLPSRIYLTGFMGSGKSTTGLVLARKLDYDFLDLDLQIEKGAKKSVATIFEEEGEAVFRAREAELLKETLPRNHLVIATGGGTMLSPESLLRAKSAGLVVYLRLDAEALAKRLRRVTNRPILRDSNGEILPERAFFERIKALLSQRTPFYEQADLIVEVGSLSPESVAEAIECALNERA